MENVKENSEENSVVKPITENVEKNDKLLDEVINSTSSSNSRPSDVKESQRDLHDDVPAGFFDDFMRKDFIDGFQILEEITEGVKEVEEISNCDANEVHKEESDESNGGKTSPKEVCKKDEAKKEKDESNSEKISHNKVQKEDKVKKEDNKKSDSKRTSSNKVHKEVETKKGNGKRVHTNNSNLKEDRNKCKETSSKNRQSPQSERNRDSRRDPEKTRRAIQRDKMFSTKEKEKQLITDIVQTGLVPPGMELDELQEIEEKKLEREPKEAKKSKGRSSERSHTSSHNSKRKRLDRVRKSRSPVKRERVSPNRKSPIYRRSRVSPVRYRRMSRNRSRSPVLIRSRDLEERRGFSLRKRSRSRSRSRSSHRKDKKRDENKLSFLEELAVKLNASSTYSDRESANTLRSQNDERFHLLEELAVKLNSSSVPLQSQSVKVPVTQIYPGHVESSNTTQFFQNKSHVINNLLSTSTNVEVNVSKNAQKTWVVQRCEAATRLLNESVTAELSVKKTNMLAGLTNEYTSPLLRNYVEIPFTSGKGKSNENDYKTRCRNFLKAVDLKVHAKPTIMSDFDSIPEELPVETRSFSTQTDLQLMFCNQCRIRGKTSQTNSSTQTTFSSQFTVGTQVTEADFYSMIPKTQSLASLTPAQLLGRQTLASDTITKALEQIAFTRDRGPESSARSVNLAPSKYETPRQYLSSQLASRFAPGMNQPARPSYNGDRMGSYPRY